MLFTKKRMVVAEEHPIRAAAQSCEGWQDTKVTVAGQSLAAQVASTEVTHVLKKLGETSPRDVLMKFWISEAIPGGLVKLQASTRSGKPDAKLYLKAVAFKIVPLTQANPE